MNNMDEKEDTIDPDLVKSILSSGSFGSFGFSPAFGLLGAMLMSKKKTNEMKTDIEIPFGAKDSELKGWEYTIPEGMEAIVKDGKVIVREKESEDERIRKGLIYHLKELRDWKAGSMSPIKVKEHYDAWIAYLEKQKEIPMPDSTELIKMWDREKAVLKEIDFRGDEWSLAHNAFMDGFSIGTCVKFEKQKEQKPVMIQWTGKNLKEVIDFTGKSPKFGEWFKSWDEYEEYVHSHNDILKLFCENGSHYEVPKGAWIVKTPDGYNVASRSKFIQKSAEWSEEDEEMLDAMVDIVANSLYEPLCPRDKMLCWLKSLRPDSYKNCNSRWKPSEEQMAALAAAKMGVDTDYELLESLYEQLKAL